MYGQNGSPATSSRIFIDPEQYQLSIRGGEIVCWLSLGAGIFRAELTTIPVGQLTLQSGRENLPRLSRTSMPPNTVGILGWIGDGPFPVVRAVQIRRGE
jgi:hypothetical protein